MTKPRILIDMDCTVADFQLGACKAHGIKYRSFLEAHVPGEYGTHLVFERVLGKPISQEEFWAPITADPCFWLYLDPLPWATELYELVRDVTDDFEFVTSHSKCPTCVHQKEQWLLTHLGPDAADQMTACRRKHLMAKPGVVLIDDTESTCNKFRKEGGHAVVFPALHNSLHDVSHKPMSWVKPAVTSAAGWCGRVRQQGGW
jgi:5'(3')-deoxyribonucleotidase